MPEATVTEQIEKRLAGMAARYPVEETLTLGIDVGIASCGWALVRAEEGQGEIVAAGAWCFEPPEFAKDRKLKNVTRREKRLLRRVIGRRSRRLQAVRRLLVEHGLLASPDPDDFHNKKKATAPDPWIARCHGLDECLDDAAFAAALIHMAKHRGFKSNSKSERAKNAPADGKKMLGAIGANEELLARYRTVGEMVHKDAKFDKHKRNKGGDYAHTMAREAIKNEVEKLFRQQRRFGNAKASEELREAYCKIAYFQRPLQASEHLVGPCPFEPDEIRSPRHAPSFEKFRLLAKLNTVKVHDGADGLRRLRPAELSAALEDFGATRKLTWNALAKKLGLPDGTAFDSVDDKRTGKDVVSEKGSMAGAAMLRAALGPAAWISLRADSEAVDEIARAIAYRDDPGQISEELKALKLEPVVVEALMAGVRGGTFADFAGTGHISAKASRALIPELLDGHVYSEACAHARYDHARALRVDLEDIGNRVVQRSVREALKQVETLVHEFAVRPGRVIIEFARDVGKSADERKKITDGLDRRYKTKQKLREEMTDLLGLGHEPSEQDLRRFELWKEQNERCI